MTGSGELGVWIKGEYKALSGKKMTGEYGDMVRIGQLAHGGMSSGGVSGEWRMKDGIPPLKSGH